MLLGLYKLIYLTNAYSHLGPGTGLDFVKGFGSNYYV